MKHYKEIILIIISLLIKVNLKAQNNYELLFLEGEFDQIYQLSQKFSYEEDYYWNSIILNKQGKILEAIQILEQGYKQFNDSQIIEKFLAELLFKTGQYTKAKPLLLKYEGDSDFFMQFINILEFENNYTLAIESLNKKILADSLNLDYLVHLGNNYFQIDSIEIAIKFYEEALTINSEDQVIAYKLANLYFKNKNYTKTIEICNIILNNDTTNKKFIKLKGIASFNNNDFIEAESKFNYLFNEGDSSKFIIKSLGISEFNNSSFETSREHLNLAYKLDSTDSEICFYLGKAYLNSRTPYKGLYYFNKVESLLQPDTIILAAIYIEKQSIYSSLDMYKEALRCYETAYKYNPKPEYIFYIATYYYERLNDNKKALENYEKFLHLLPPKSESENNFRGEQIILSIKNIAEKNIEKIKEELFFNGELNE